MKKSHRHNLLVSVASILLIFVSTSLALGVEVPAEQWVQSFKTEEGWKALTLDETVARETSFIYGTANDPRTNLTAEQQREKYFCKNILADECKKYFTLEYNSLLPVCDDSITTFCLEEIYAIKPNGERVSGKFQKYTQALPFAYDSSEKHGLPAGAYPSLWEIPGITNGSGSSSYVVTPYVYGSTMGFPLFENPKSPWHENLNFAASQVNSSIYPVSTISGNQYKPIIATDASMSAAKIFGSANHGNNMCAAQDVGVCYLRNSFPMDVIFGMILRAPKRLNPWIHGRIIEPKVMFSKINSDFQKVDVQGLPMRISNLGSWVRVEKLTDEIKQWILGDQHENGGSGQWENHRSLTKTFAYNIGVSGTGNINQLRMWLPVLGDTATANPSTWSFRFLENRELEGADSCIQRSESIAGFVSTNAAVYSAGPPVFNKSQGSLDYTVIAPHFDSSGKEFVGTYDLLIKDQVARCIYGFSDVPIKAEVSIVGDGGETKVATTTVSKQGDWISLSAKGFTYSSPTIRVKLSQEKVEKAQEISPNVSASAEGTSPSKPVTLKKSIICSKGKSLKKVTGINPKCPKGYKLVK